jgi:integrase
MSKATINLYLDVRYKKDNDPAYPVKIRITHKRAQYYLLTDERFTPSEWKRGTGKRNDDKELEARFDKLNTEVLKIKDIAKNLRTFSFETIKEKYFRTGKGNVLVAHFQAYEKNLLDNDQIRTAQGYISARKSFEAFEKGLTLENITAETLKKYEAWMLREGNITARKDKTKKGNSQTAISIYTRCLRTIFNKAISDGDLDRSHYPFGRYKYQIPAPRQKKKALRAEELASLRDYEPTNDPDQFAKDMFLLAYRCGGRNPVDLCYLTYDKWQGDTLTFEYRIKTARSAPNQDPLIIQVDDEIQDILDRWKTRQSKTGFILPVLDKSMDSATRVHSIQLFTHKCNDGLARIAKILELPVSPTLGCARTSVANDLLIAGTPMSIISNVLGHQSQKTTQIYLKSLPVKTVNEELKKLRAVKSAS